MFSDKLHYLRKQQELTQSEVAQSININQTTYSRYERGSIEPDIATIKKLANFFDVSIDYLLENDKQFDDTDTLVDFNNFILNGNYTINSKFPTTKERRMINNIIHDIFDDK